MAFENGIAIVLAYVVVSVGVGRTLVRVHEKEDYQLSGDADRVLSAMPEGATTD
jgi:hypothetical protein